MKLYRVYILSELRGQMEVYAESEQAAREYAVDKGSASEWYGETEVRVTDIEDITPEED